MSQAEKLLSALVDIEDKHIHPVVDSDTYFTIDPLSRTITNTARRKNILMQYDHESERFTFELNRQVEGHDMSLCNRVRVHWNNIDGITGEETADVHEIDDLRVNPDNPETVICSWLITRNSTQRVGVLSFLIQYMCMSDNGDVTYEWHSDIYSDIEIKQGRNNAEQAVVEYSDIIEQWRNKLFGAGDSVIVNIEEVGQSQVKTIQNEGESQLEAVTSEGEKQKSAVELKGVETLATIPEDYTTTHNMAEEALRRKADAIVLEAAGDIIEIDNASNGYLLGIKMYGRTEQITTNGYQLANFANGQSSSHLVGTFENDVLTLTGEAALYANYSTDITDIYLSNPGKTLYFVYEKIEFENEPDGTIVQINIKKTDNTWKYSGIVTKNETKMLYTIPEDVSDVDTVTVNIYTSNNTTPSANTVKITKPMLQFGTDVLPYEVYTGGKASPSLDHPQDLVSIDNPTVTICGKNLFDISKGLGNNFTESNGVYTLTRNGESSRFSNPIPVNIPAGTPITFSVNVLEYTKSTESLPLYYKGVSGKSYYASVRKVVTSTYDEDIVSVSFYLQSSEEVGAYIKFNNVQLELGKVMSDYEPYKEIQSITIPHTLSSVKTKLDGNYVDSNGQKYFCDIVDFENKVFIQKIQRKQITMLNGGYLANGNYYAVMNTNDKVFNNAGILCDGAKLYDSSIGYETGYMYENPMNIVFIGTPEDTHATMSAKYANTIVQYVLAEPIIIPLTDEEIATFKALHTNYPNTTILNDSGAHMEIKYAADTLIYLRDNQPVPTDEQVANAVNAYAGQNGIQVPSDDHIRSLAKECLPDNQENETDDGIADSIKIAILNCFANVAWSNSEGEVYYNALKAALNFNGTLEIPPIQVSNETSWTSGIAYDLNIVKDEYVQLTSGKFLTYVGWDRTNYVYCEGCSQITFPPCPQIDGEPNSTAFYDTTKTRLSYFILSKTDYTTVDVPAGACYFAISSDTTALSACIATGIIPKA